jgi:hypothetical protein
MLTQDYWTSRFDIKQADLTRIYESIKNSEYPVQISEISKKLIRGRIKYGDDLSPAALSTWTGDATTRIWNPSEEWNIGDRLVVITKSPESNYEEYEAYVGHVISTDPINDDVTVQLGIEKKKYVRASPGSENAIKWHDVVKEIVAQKIKSAEIDDQVTAVLAQFGDRIISRLVEILEQDERFITINNQWFLTELIAPLPRSQVLSIYKKLIELGKSQQLDAIKSLCDPPLSEDIIGDFMLLRGLEEHPHLFQKNTIGNHITWNAILPDPDQIQIHRFAYDPDTYEIISAPGRKLNTQTSQRLQELGLFAHVIELGDEL